MNNASQMLIITQDEALTPSHINLLTLAEAQEQVCVLFSVPRLDAHPMCSLAVANGLVESCVTLSSFHWAFPQTWFHNLPKDFISWNSQHGTNIYVLSVK